VYHVATLSANLLFVPQLTEFGKKVEFLHDMFAMKNMNDNLVVVVEGILDPKDKPHKFCDFPKKDSRSIALNQDCQLK
jgi:hypothetical protein